MYRYALAVLVILTVALMGCEKKDTPDPTQPAPKETTRTDTTAKAPAPVPKPEPAPAPAGPEPSNDKEMLGLDLKGFGPWKPVWDPDAKVAKWENDDVMTGIVIRLVSDKLDNVDDLKSAAPMMMQLGSAITKVEEEKKTDKGWYAVVMREDVKELVYMQKFGSKQIVCSANLTKSDMGTIKKEDALKACNSIDVKK